jgi:hypothetical protein
MRNTIVCTIQEMVGLVLGGSNIGGGRWTTRVWPSCKFNICAGETYEKVCGLVIEQRLLFCVVPPSMSVHMDCLEGADLASGVCAKCWLRENNGLAWWRMLTPSLSA